MQNMERVMVALCAKFFIENNDRRHCLSAFVYYDAVEEISASSPWKSMKNKIFMMHGDSAVERAYYAEQREKNKSEEYTDNVSSADFYYFCIIQCSSSTFTEIEI